MEEDWVVEPEGVKEGEERVLFFFFFLLLVFHQLRVGGFGMMNGNRKGRLGLIGWFLALYVGFCVTFLCLFIGKLIFCFDISR